MPSGYKEVDIEAELNEPPPYMDPTNSIAKKKASIIHKQSSLDHPGKPCDHCGQFPSGQHVMIWPAPRPAEHIRPDNSKFIWFIIALAAVIFLVFLAAKYLP